MLAIVYLFSVTTWCTLTACALAAFYLWWKRPHHNFPPGARGIPFLGVLPYCSDFPHEDFNKWSMEKYGPIMSVRLGSKDVVVLNTYDAIYEAFVKQSSELTGRPNLAVYTQVSHDLGIMFVDDSDVYRKQRQFGMQILKKGGLEKNKMENILLSESSLLIEALRKKGSSPFTINVCHKPPINIFYPQPVISLSTSNVASLVILGKRVDESNPQFKRLFTVLNRVFYEPKMAYKTMLLILFWNLRYIPPFKKANQLVKSYLGELSDLFQEFVDERKENFDPENATDFLGAYIKEQLNRTQEQDTSFSDDQLKVYTRDLFVASTETSSTNLCWCLILLLNHSQYYHPIVKEILDVLKPGEKFSLSMKEDLPLTSAFLQEVLRFRIPAPMSHHKAASNIKLLGYDIPKGTQVTANFYGACMDPDLWPKPEVFDPQRHIDEQGRFVFSPKVMVFSAGFRFCMGERLARAEVLFLFVEIIRNFHIESVNGAPSMVPGSSNIVLPPREFQVVLTERTHLADRLF